MSLSQSQMRPVIALAMGDPAGISPELTAKLCALEEIADIAQLAVIGDRRMFGKGAADAGLDLTIETMAAGQFAALKSERHVFIDLAHLDPSECPYPADTVFLRAVKEGYRAVLTMYHDQGQIAMKLMGFDEGVTMIGGLPFPLCTPAHGTAYDIAGKGIANIGASREAILLAARMASRTHFAAG